MIFRAIPGPGGPIRAKRRMHRTHHGYGLGYGLKSDQIAPHTPLGDLSVSSPQEHSLS